MCKCPHCGRPYPATEPPTSLQVGGDLRQQLVNIVASREDGIGGSELEQQLYPGRTDRRRTIAVMICKANKVLEPQGYRISSTLGRGSRYFLRDLKDEQLSHGDCSQRIA